MHTFIKTLCMRLSNPGAAHRSQMIFDQAMARGEYRWGRKAKLTAGASVAVALRESHKSDSLRDIAVSILFSSSAVRPTHSFVDPAFFSLDPPRRFTYIPFTRVHFRNQSSPTRSHVLRSKRPSRSAADASRSFTPFLRHNLTEIPNHPNQTLRTSFHIRNEDLPFTRLVDHATRLTITSPDTIHRMCDLGTCP